MSFQDMKVLRNKQSFIKSSYLPSTILEFSFAHKSSFLHLMGSGVPLLRPDSSQTIFLPMKEKTTTPILQSPMEEVSRSIQFIHFHGTSLLVIPQCLHLGSCHFCELSLEWPTPFTHHLEYLFCHSLAEFSDLLLLPCLEIILPDFSPTV